MGDFFTHIWQIECQWASGRPRRISQAQRPATSVAAMRSGIERAFR